MSSLKPLHQFSPDFTWGLLSKECLLTICSDGSAPLNKMAAMPIFGEKTEKSSSPVLRKLCGWILIYSIGDARSTKNILKWWEIRMTYLLMVWSNLCHSCCGNTGRTLQICNSCFYQVSELWPSFIEISVFNANSVDPDQTLYSAASGLGIHYLPITLLRVSQLKWVKGYPALRVSQLKWVKRYPAVKVFGSRWNWRWFFLQDILTKKERNFTLPYGKRNKD